MPRESKPGESRGGRQRGTPNKSNVLKKAAMSAVQWMQDMPEFSSFQKLCLHREEGRDFQIRKQQRGSRVAIIAPHGWTIEPVTSRLAEATAGDSFSWYCFEGIKGNRGNLHITSANFDEPQCLNLIAPCEIVLAIHGRKDAGDPTTIFVGGLNEVQRDLLCSELKNAGFSATTANKKFRGRDRSNICNRGQQGMGVQLELPRSLRDRLDTDEGLFSAFVEALNRVIDRALGNI